MTLSTLHSLFPLLRTSSEELITLLNNIFLSTAWSRPVLIIPPLSNTDLYSLKPTVMLTLGFADTGNIKWHDTKGLYKLKQFTTCQVQCNCSQLIHLYSPKRQNQTLQFDKNGVVLKECTYIESAETRKCAGGARYSFSSYPFRSWW